jgi:hypothetical protein
MEHKYAGVLSGRERNEAHRCQFYQGRVSSSIAAISFSASEPFAASQNLQQPFDSKPLPHYSGYFKRGVYIQVKNMFEPESEGWSQNDVHELVKSHGQ